jgi:hypothetical protein
MKTGVFQCEVHIFCKHILCHFAYLTGLIVHLLLIQLHCSELITYYIFAFVLQHTILLHLNVIVAFALHNFNDYITMNRLPDKMWKWGFHLSKKSIHSFDTSRLALLWKYYFQMLKLGVNIHLEDYHGKMKGLHCNLNFHVTVSGNQAN